MNVLAKSSSAIRPEWVARYRYLSCEIQMTALLAKGISEGGLSDPSTWGEGGMDILEWKTGFNEHGAVEVAPACGALRAYDEHECVMLTGHADYHRCVHGGTWSHADVKQPVKVAPKVERKLAKGWQVLSGWRCTHRTGPSFTHEATSSVELDRITRYSNAREASCELHAVEMGVFDTKVERNLAGDWKLADPATGAICKSKEYNGGPHSFDMQVRGEYHLRTGTRGYGACGACAETMGVFESDLLPTTKSSAEPGVDGVLPPDRPTPAASRGGESEAPIPGRAWKAPRDISPAMAMLEMNNVHLRPRWR